MTENNMAEAQAHAAPILTLHSDAEAKLQVEQAVEKLDELNAQAPQAPDAKEAVASLESSLTEEEKKQVEEFSKTIDLTNPDHVMLYGADAQKKISGFADTVLSNVKTGDTGEVGDMLTKLVTELKGFNAAGEKPKGLRGLFFGAKQQISTIQAKYEDVSKNVEGIAGNLEEHQVQLLKDVAMPLRFMLTGYKVSPGIFEVVELLGYDEVARRLKHYGIL